MDAAIAIAIRPTDRAEIRQVVISFRLPSWRWRVTPSADEVLRNQRMAQDLEIERERNRPWLVREMLLFNGF